ncbi:AraC family transcriptional regulator [Burkholderia gladioli]|uniref:AraC family transcriptional regulator n=1 Tax=Burkholderia gladioli TaxID=28095 RepID=UPI00264F9F5E|nr:AraC family transcriptional regulator [Burkholderia gladioli]MDN7751188.1 AraC family transcriptional regulator [Burkholderia gladioli]
MREYDANLVSRSVTRLGGTSIELVRRRIEAGAPARLHVAHERHAIYAEMSRGFECERQVAGAARERFVSEPGLVSFRPAGSEVRGSTIGEGIVSYGLVLIDPRQDWLDDLQGALRPLTALRHARLAAELASMFEACAAGEAAGATPFAALHAQGRSLALLALLADQGGTAPAVDRVDARLAAVTAWIDAHLTQEFSLAELAEVAHLSVSQLVRQFRRRLGITPMRHVSNARLKEAQRLLAQTRWPVARIAAHLGYIDASHFTSRFRANTGATPAAWRRRLHGR